MKPRVLMTGFGAFPGAPVNPTEALMSAIDARSEEFAEKCRLETRVFDVDYRTLPARLDEIGHEASPDIAIHFGVAASARGFRLERIARNEVRAGSPDNAGYLPDNPAICSLDAIFESGLPLDAIGAALAEAGLPVEYSDDAGGYLCNFLFYHARSGLCDAYRPPMAGFIHVPPLPGPFAPHGLPAEAMLEGALIVLRTCLDRWLADKAA